MFWKRYEVDGPMNHKTSFGTFRNHATSRHNVDWKSHRKTRPYCPFRAKMLQISKKKWPTKDDPFSSWCGHTVRCKPAELRARRGLFVRFFGDWYCPKFSRMHQRKVNGRFFVKSSSPSSDTWRYYILLRSQSSVKSSRKYLVPSIRAELAKSQGKKDLCSSNYTITRQQQLVVAIPSIY